MHTDGATERNASTSEASTTKANTSKVLHYSNLEATLCITDKKSVVITKQSKKL